MPARGLLIVVLLCLAGCGSAPAEHAATAGPAVAAPAVDSATVRLPVAVLDSLRADLQRLSAQVAALQQGDTLRAAGLAAPPPDTVVPARRELIPSGEVLQDAREAVQSYGLKAFLAVLVLVLGSLLVRGVVFLLERLAERNAARRLFYKRLVPIARILLWAAAVTFVIRGIFQVGAQGLLAAAAAIGVAVGFAAQDILKNIFGGLVIVFDAPFQVGDKISVGGTYGEVVGIGLRSTRIVTPDDNLVSVPNAQVVDGQVANANAGALDCQVVTDLYLPGWADEALAKRIAYEAAASSKYVYLEKPIVVLVRDEFKETYLTHIKVKAYVLDTRYEFLLMSDVTERARAEFRRHGLFHPVHDPMEEVGRPSLPPAAGTAPAEAPHA